MLNEKETEMEVVVALTNSEKEEKIRKLTKRISESLSIVAKCDWSPCDVCADYLYEVRRDLAEINSMKSGRN